MEIQAWNTCMYKIRGWLLGLGIHGWKWTQSKKPHKQHAYVLHTTHTTNGGNMSKTQHTMDKVTITTRTGTGTQVRTLSPKEIKPNTKYNTFHYEGKDGE